MAADGSIKIDTSIDGKGFQAGLDKLGGAAKSALGGMVKLVGTVAAALGAGAAYAIKTGMDFEAEMSRVAAISGATGKELQSLTNQAKQLGADTAFSASEAAEGMENLASAGFTTKEIMSAMPGMLDLAASSGEDLANSADIAASTLRGFGLAASDAGHVADVLAKNAAQTNAAVADTGLAMKYVAPVARNAGWSLESVTAAIGEMADAGIKGEQAGTTLRGALTRLMKPTKQMQDAMDGIGFSVYDTAGKMKPLSRMIDELNKKTAGMSAEQKNAAIATIFGTESLSGMQVLLQDGSANLDDMTASLQNSTGAADEMAKTMQDNLKGAVEQLKGSVETLAIDIYESVDNPLKAVAQNATEYVNQIESAFKSGGVNGLVSELGTVFSDAAVKIANAAPGMIKAATSMIQSFLTGIQQNSGQMATAAVEILTVLANGILISTSQLGAVGLSLITGIIQGITPQLPQIAAQAVIIAGQLLQGILQALPSLITAGMQIIIGLIQGLTQAVPQLLPVIVTAILQIVQTLYDNIPLIMQAGIDLLMGIVQALPSVIQALIGALPGLIESVINYLVSAIPIILDGAIQLLTAIVDAIPKIIPPLLQALPQIINTLINGLVKAIPQLLQGAIQFLTAIIQAIPTIVQALVTNLPLIISTIIKVLIQNIPLLITTAIQLFMAIIKAIPQIVIALAQNMPQIITAIVGGLKAGLGDVADAGKQLIYGVWDGIKGTADWLWNQVKGFFGGLMSKIKKFLGIHSPSKVWADEIGRFLPPGITVGMGKAMPATIRDMKSQLAGMMDQARSAVATEQARISTGFSSRATYQLAYAGAGSDFVETAPTTFNQYNYSPKALTPAETARQTRNILRQARLKGK